MLPARSGWDPKTDPGNDGNPYKTLCFLTFLDFSGTLTMTISGLIFWLRVVKSDPQYVFGIPSTIFQSAGRDLEIPENANFRIPRTFPGGVFFSRMLQYAKDPSRPPRATPPPPAREGAAHRPPELRDPLATRVLLVEVR